AANSRNLLANVLGRAYMSYVLCCVVFQTSNSHSKIPHVKAVSACIYQEIDKKVVRNIQMIFKDPVASLNAGTKVDYIVSEGFCNIQELCPRRCWMLACC
ncbi:MAG: hypothetical protein LBF82_01535, partial [Lactobacillales bacterium]|nr:hypothetical protein [Lactobacillales bacterium]